MKDRNETNRFLEYSNILKETDEIYRSAAKSAGLPEAAFWILYALRAQGGVLTQSEICDTMYQPKQTVNSALKKMEAEGYIELRRGSDRRSKEILLTKEGIRLAGDTVDGVIAAEREALYAMTDAEQETFLRLLRRHADLLRGKLQGET